MDVIEDIQQNGLFKYFINPHLFHAKNNLISDEIVAMKLYTLK